MAAPVLTLISSINSDVAREPPESGEPVTGYLVYAGLRLYLAGQAPLAQSAERLHGKEKVYGSIP
jgi:hypothetical protein